MDVIEEWVRGLGIAAGLAVLAIALWQGVWRGLRHGAGRTIGNADKILRRPFLFVAAFLWLGLLFFLWHPLPLTLMQQARVIALILGALFYFPGLVAYLWGARHLGEMYRPSSSFGVQLNVNHRLITQGPFAYVRHPMYLGLQITALGGLLIYRNWAFAFVLMNFLGLFIRARREEQALAAEFGEQWKAYSQITPAWLPRLRH